MYDWFHAALKKLDYNRWLAGGILLSILLLSFAFSGCESTVASMVTPGQDVTRLELAGEDIGLRASFEGRKAVLDAGYAALAVDVSAHEELKTLHVEILDRKDALKVQLLEFVGVAANAITGGRIDGDTLAYTIGVCGSILGIAAFKDKFRTDKLWAKEKKAKEDAAA